MNITVFSQPGCTPCARVKAWLNSKNVDFTERNVQEDADALDTILDLGYSGVPVIMAGDKHWSGIDLAKMKELV